MASYFVDHKRGEVAELRTLLRSQQVQRDAKKCIEVVKKVIAYMTLGIDMSSLFNEIIMNAYTQSLVLKKMIYLYMCTYAEQKPDFAIMAINTLQKEMRDHDPRVRGLALRSICSLRLPNLEEYVQAPIRKCLKDSDPYVRKTAIMGCTKLFNSKPQLVKNSDYVDILYNMIRDKDSTVVCNAIQALNEILADEGKMALNQPIVMHLLNRIHEFNEWGQCVVLDLVARYTRASDQEMFDIMNLLEDRLQNANAAVVVGTTKVFLHFTQNHPQIHKQVFHRVRAPLLTLMTTSSWELTYTVLTHIELMVRLSPGVFDDQYKHFFIRYNDQLCVKVLKLSILEHLVDARNYREIMAELGEYVVDVDAEIARKAVQGIAVIAQKIEPAVEDAIDALLSFLDLQSDYVTAETAIVMKDLLRKYPDRYSDVIPALQKSLKQIDDYEGKVAVIWMIGEYGDTIKKAPYMLEPIIEAYAEESSPKVRLELLTTTMKLFFKRPPELQAMLGSLLAKASADSHIEVKEKALFYYRLLRYDVHEAARVVNCPKVIVDKFVEETEDAKLQQIFGEFNSLSVVYKKPEQLFVTGYTGVLPEEAEAEEEATASTALKPVDESEEKQIPVTASRKIIIGLDEAFDEQPASEVPLNPQPSIDPALFQTKWASLTEQRHLTLQLRDAANTASSLEGKFSAKSILPMASGVVGDQMKMYLFAQDNSSAFYLLEVVANLSNNTVIVTIKSDGALLDDIATLISQIVSAI